MFKKTSFNPVSLLAIVIALAALLMAANLVRAMPGAAPQAPQVGAPTVVSYQGQVQVADEAYEGSGYFKFAIVDAAGTTTYWSNDDSSTDGGEPTTGVSLPVSNGLFNVLLGDTALANMTQPLEAAAFEGTERHLRVWFSADDTTYQQLSPDQRIAAVPYALQAQAAAEADTLDGQHAADLELPAGAMVLGYRNDTTLIAAGFSDTGLTVEADDWLVKAAMPTGRSYLAAAAVDGIIYAIGGASETDTYLQTNEAYDPVTDSWSTKANMPTGRGILAAAAVDGIIYAFGGSSAAHAEDPVNEAYDPVTDSWSTKTDMLTPRRNAAAAVADGIIHVIGGFPEFQANEAYNPHTDSWSTRADMPTARAALATASVDDIIYALGGMAMGAVDANEAYDPVTDTWSTKAAMPTEHAFFAAVAVDDIIYAIGGTYGGDGQANEAYDPATNSWSTKAYMPTDRGDIAAAVVDGVIYVLGGGANYAQINEAYYPELRVYIKE